MILIAKLKNLSRPVVFSSLTNRIIIYISLTVFVLFLIYQSVQGIAFLPALVHAAGTGFSVFLCWALGREIDPANAWSAFAAVPFVIVAALADGAPSIITLLFIILIGRALNRTAGARLSETEALLLAVLGIGLYYNGFVTGLPVLAVVLAVEAALDPVNRRQLYIALLSAALFAAGSLLFSELLPPAPELNLFKGIVILLLTAAVIFITLATRGDRASGDLDGRPLEKRRLLLARVMPALFIALEIAFKGSIAILALYPALLAYLGVALFHMTRLIYNKRKVIT